MTSHWLIKSEPSAFSWQRFVEEKHAVWDGVRNFEARNNLRAMKRGDLAFFYHSNVGKEIVGVARVVETATQDPSTEEDWSVVGFAPVAPLVRAVTLAEIKQTEELKNFALVKKSRISVIPVNLEEFQLILKMGKTRLK